MRDKIKKALRNNKVSIYGYDFDLVKGNNVWLLLFDGMKVTQCGHKKKKNALYYGVGNLLCRGRDETLKQIDSHKKLKRLKRFISKVKPIFIKTFGFNFPRCITSYVTGVDSIDVIKFDEMIKVPDGISTYDYVGQTYGGFAVKLLKRIVSYN